MGKWNNVVRRSVVGHQDPAGQALIEFRQSIGNRRVSRLHQERLNVSKQQLMQGLACFYRLPELIGRDPFTDIAVLQVTTQGLKAATLANSDSVPVGALAVAIGSPLGEFQNTVTHGIVSAKGRRVAETSQVILEDLIQTDAPINPGNSGGPLLWAATHQVIGVNTLGVSQATGINFAVSSNTVKQIADEIIANGKVVRGYIGIQYSPITPRQAAQLGLPTGTIGIIVSQVVPGSPAEQSGIQVNDIITKVNDQVIDADHPLSSLLVKNRPGDKVKLTLIRGGKEMTVDVTLGQPAQ